MAQNYRQSSGRSDYGRGGRYQTGGDRDRYRTGNEQRFSPDWDDRNQSRGFEGDRSYSAGGYSEEFGYGRAQNRDERDRDDRSSYGRRGQGDYRQSLYDQSGQSGYGSRYGEERFDEANRWSEGASDDDFDDLYRRDRGTTTSRWHEDQGDRGGYFGTGSYIDDGGASRGLGGDFDRARRETQRRYGRGDSRGTSGDFSSYGRSEYGAQSGYGRGGWQGRDEHPWRSAGSYAERSGWGYGDQYRGQSFGSGSTSGAYGRDSGYRSGYGSYAGSQSQQSHRGRGPQGYQRSDERLKEMICERLTDDPAIDASNISVDVTNQVVKLTGSVEDRGTKYEVEELIEQLGGVKDVDNQLRVHSSSQTGSSQQLRGGSDWEPNAGSVSSATSGSLGRSTSGTTGSSTTGSSTKRN